MEFKTEACGTPANLALVKSRLIMDEVKFRYETVANGAAYCWHGVIECEPTGRIRSEDTFFGTKIFTEYVTDDGFRFWWVYGEGSPRNFDYAAFRLGEC